MTNQNKERLTLRLSSETVVNRETIRPKSMGRVFTSAPRRVLSRNNFVQDKPAANVSTEAQKRRQTYIGARTTARFHAMQALYQFEMTQAKPSQITSFFEDVIFGEPMEGEMLVSPDQGHFRLLVQGAIQNIEKIDELLQERLLKGWSLSRLDRVICALLRVACFELLILGKTQPRIVINEFVTVATTFFEGEAIGLINGILDGLARAHNLMIEKAEEQAALSEVTAPEYEEAVA